MFEKTQASSFRIFLYWVTTLALAVGIGCLAGFVIGDAVFKPWLQDSDDPNFIIDIVNNIQVFSQFLIFIGPIVCCILYNRSAAKYSEYKYYHFVLSPLVSIAAAAVLEIALFILCWIIKAAIVIIVILIILGIFALSSFSKAMTDAGFHPGEFYGSQQGRFT